MVSGRLLLALTCLPPLLYAGSPCPTVGASRALAFVPPYTEPSRLPSKSHEPPPTPSVAHIGRSALVHAVNPLHHKASVSPNDAPLKRVDPPEEMEKRSGVSPGNIMTTEMIAVGAWVVSISSLILVNYFVEPWPSQVFETVPGSVSRLLHYLGGMLFAGGILLTTFFEWLVVDVASSNTSQEKASTVLSFWFDQVPMFDAAVVLPGLTLALIAGIGLSVDMYGSLGAAPVHITAGFHALVAFAAWWGLTDLTTQSKAARAIEREWGISSSENGNNRTTGSKPRKIPAIVQLRRVSNVVSCSFVVALYAIMTLKPGLPEF